jgi:uncharacterized protein YjbI with pentapeptide repeats
MKRLKPTLEVLLTARSIGILMAIMAAVIALTGVRSRSSDRPNANVWIDDFYSNVAVDLAFTALTILVIDSLDDRRERKMEKDRLKLQMGSPNNGTATEAVRVLRFHGWLTDGSLKETLLEGADLSHCNLTGCQLQGAKMAGVNLTDTVMKHSNLTHAMLNSAQLQDCDLSDSTLDHAMLYGANLQHANLSNSSLKGANLMNADLRGANLYRVDLTDANLRNADFTDANLLHVTVTPEQLKRALSLRGVNIESDR